MKTTAMMESEETSSDARQTDSLAERYTEIRRFTEKLCEPLATEDCVIQSMPDASPTKWHLAHTTWFFETFILKPQLPEYQSAVPEYGYLFNSYYNAAGPMHCRDRRGLISRPTVQETYLYREQIDRQIVQLLEEISPRARRAVEPVLTLGLHHEQQHQELLLTDVKHVFAQNPLYPVYAERDVVPSRAVPPLEWIEFAEGIYWIGHDGDGFAFDNERPCHRQFLDRFALASRPVTNGEFIQFIEDEGYERSEFWLSLGWQTLRQCGWNAPLYWEKKDGVWYSFTLSGVRPVDPSEPVCHVSYFEADAYARWAKARLPSEAEWELAASSVPVEGTFVEDKHFHPTPLGRKHGSSEIHQLFGDVWEWTRSAYAPYPGYVTTEGALGEYNGKFMCNQMVLRGGSCVSSRSHLRTTYRNFFPPDKRWQFSGIRLARDVGLE